MFTWRAATMILQSSDQSLQFFLPKHHARHAIGKAHFAVERFGVRVVFAHFEVDATIAVLRGVIDNPAQQKMPGTYITTFRSNDKIVDINQRFSLKSREVDIAVGQSHILFVG